MFAVKCCARELLTKPTCVLPQLQRMLHSLQQAERTHAASGTNGPNAHQLNAAQPEMLNAHSGERGTLAEVVAYRRHVAWFHPFVAQNLIFYFLFYPQKLLDRFEYDDEPEDVAPNDPASSL